MRVNTHLMNLVRQILEAEEAKSKLDADSKEARWAADKIADLKDDAITEMIRSAPFKTTYTSSSALQKLNETIQLFAIFGKEDQV